MTKDFFVLSSKELEFKLDLMPRDDSTEDEDANVDTRIPSLRQDEAVLGIPTKPPTKA
jgi:hypothetical protein|tara:strand:- start:44 stop:217 length:174 start_codon:yes stop_codon:yes gene_type:complete